MKQEKIVESILSAANHLEDSLEALAKNDEENLESLVWGASADLEYALFLFSLIHQDEGESSSWKAVSHSKQVETSSTRSSVQNLLRKAKSKMESGELLDAHWEIKKRRSDKMSDSFIDECYETAKKKGALGGKLIGAGGGGFFMFFCYNSDKPRLSESMKKLGLKPVQFHFDFEGAKILVNMKKF